MLTNEGDVDDVSDGQHLQPWQRQQPQPEAAVPLAAAATAAPRRRRCHHRRLPRRALPLRCGAAATAAARCTGGGAGGDDERHLGGQRQREVDRQLAEPGGAKEAQPYFTEEQHQE